MERHVTWNISPGGYVGRPSLWPLLQLAFVPTVCSCTWRLGPWPAPPWRDPPLATQACPGNLAFSGTLDTEHFGSETKIS